MILRAAILLLTFLNSLSEATDYWKHSEQQGEVGSCHTFATIGLVEAEYWKSTGKHINLSERDLFIRHYTREHQYTNGYPHTHLFINKQLRDATEQKLPDHYLEAGHITNDFALLKKHGVASEKELPYEPTFSQGISIGVTKLRHQRNLLNVEAELQKKSNQWTPSSQHKLIVKHRAKLKKVFKTLSIPKDTPTRQLTKAYLRQFSLKKLTPSTTKQAKQQIIEQLANRPVAVDITNLSELAGNASTLHSKHSLIISRYHPKTDQFSIRSSTFKGNRKVSANTLARGCYQIYYLVKQ